MGSPILARLHNVGDDGLLVPDGAASVRLDGARKLVVGDWVLAFKPDTVSTGAR